MPRRVSRSMIACNASRLALSRSGSGRRSSQAAYSACNAISSATVARQRCGRLLVQCGRTELGGAVQVLI
jgi:hypothetical protein